MFLFKFTNWMTNSVEAIWSGSTLFAKVEVVMNSRIRVKHYHNYMWHFWPLQMTWSVLSTIYLYLEYATHVKLISFNRRMIVLWYDVYLICPNYCTYPYKRKVKQFRSFQITARVFFVYFLIKAYVVGTNSNCINLSMQMSTQNICFYKKINQKNKSHIHHQISPLLILLKMYP